MAKKRITELTTETTLKDGQYVAIDHATDGTKKYDFGGALTDLKEDFEDLDDRVTALEEGGSGSGLTEDIKQALLQIAEKVAYIDEDGQDYYDALESALYPPADLVSISAVYTQSGTVYDTDSLDSLKSDLIVTATYSDHTTETVITYTLSGTLTVGTSTITVTYGGKTDTFDVTVSEYVDPRVLLYNWDLTNSLTDTVGEKTATITGATQDSSGVHLTAIKNHADFSGILSIGRTVEVDVASYSRQGTNHGRFIMVSGGDGLVYNKSGYWGLYLSGEWENTEITDPTYFNGKTVVIKFTSAESGTLISVYCDNELIVEKVETASVGLMMLGSNNSNSAYNSTFTAVRVYEGV